MSTLSSSGRVQPHLNKFPVLFIDCRDSETASTMFEYPLEYRKRVIYDFGVGIYSKFAPEFCKQSRFGRINEYF